MACALYGYTRERAYNNLPTYADKMDVFFSSIAEETSSVTCNGHDYAPDASHRYLLIEYNTASENNEAQAENYQKHDIAIFDATEGRIYYYKEGAQVDADGTVING